PLSSALWTGLISADGNTLARLAAFERLRATRFEILLDRLRDAIALVFLGALGAMTISASIGTTTLWLAGAIKGQSYAAAWSVWWTGDVMGVLVFSPFLLLVLRARFGLPPIAKLLEALAWFAGSGVVAVGVFRRTLPPLYSVFPL